MCITGLITLIQLVIILMRSWYFAEQDGMRVYGFILSIWSTTTIPTNNDYDRISFNKLLKDIINQKILFEPNLSLYIIITRHFVKKRQNLHMNLIFLTLNENKRRQPLWMQASIGIQVPKKKNRSYKMYLELQNLLIELAILNDNSKQQRCPSFGIHDTPTF